jgi:hypothetical protein
MVLRQSREMSTPCNFVRKKISHNSHFQLRWGCESRSRPDASVRVHKTQSQLFASKVAHTFVFPGCYCPQFVVLVWEHDAASLRNCNPPCHQRCSSQVCQGSRFAAAQTRRSGVWVWMSARLGIVAGGMSRRGSAHHPSPRRALMCLWIEAARQCRCRRSWLCLPLTRKRTRQVVTFVFKQAVRWACHSRRSARWVVTNEYLSDGESQESDRLLYSCYIVFKQAAGLSSTIWTANSRVGASMSNTTCFCFPPSFSATRNSHHVHVAKM